MEEEEEIKYKPGYTNFSEFCVSKEKYLNSGEGKKIAKGVEWQVFQYVDPDNEKLSVAYKQLIMIPKNIGYDTFYKALIRELDISNRARHPCTIELLSFDLSDILHPTIVTRFYVNKSLKSNFFKTKDEPQFFDDSEYAKWGNMKRTKNGVEVEDGTVYTLFMYGLARGLKYLHNLKIFHRDLKPDNIIVDELYRPHIADFGFSKQTSEDAEQSGIFGTPQYMAPEVSDESGDYSFPADIFALALIFYSLTELKSVLPKFNRHTSNITKRMIITKRYKEGKMPELSPDNKFSKLIQDMWSLAPEQRPKIDYVCDFLEDKDNWFPHTVKKDFDRFKKEINDFERAQLPLITDSHMIIKDEAGSLSKKIDLDDKSKLKETRYKNIQILFDSCSKSNYEAYCSLGTIFYTGYLGIPKDYVTAWRYFKEAKNHGNVQADSFMMTILNEIIENEKKVHNEYFLKLTNNVQDQNDPIFDKICTKQSLLLYGMIKESENEIEKALNLYIKSYKRGCYEAKSRLGSLLFKTNKLLDLSEKILIETSRWDPSEEKNHIDDNERKLSLINYHIDDNERKLSLLNLGLLKKQKGEFDESIKIFKKLLKEDHPDAALLIGACYEMEKDIPKAKEYYKRSRDEFFNSSAEVLLQYYDNKDKDKDKDKDKNKTKK